MSFKLSPISKLALGTAQYGMNYGIANKTGQISDNEMKRILNLAQKNNIKTIDTAINYGSCEKNLGALGIDDFNIITKISNLQECSNLKNFMTKKIESSLRNLKTSYLSTLLLHSSKDLIMDKKYDIYEVLADFKNKGLCHNIGISAYNIEEVLEVVKYFDIDVVQFPFNVFNNQLIESGLLRNLKDRKIEIHVRSVFLQGLLLLNKEQVDSYFYPWIKLLKNWDKFIEDNQLTKLEACLSFVFNFDEIDKYIIGIDSLVHLQQIIDILKCQKTIKISSDFSTDDENLINPSFWKLRK